MIDKLGSEDVIWDLTSLYKDIGDDNITKDIQYIKSKITMFSTKYRKKLNAYHRVNFSMLSSHLKK